MRATETQYIWLYELKINLNVMKKLLLSLALIAGASQVNAQMPDGSIAPDFTGTDYYGNTVNLYSILDQGYTVILDVSATWCPPCWSYHQAGTLEDVWMNHGPAGMPGVSGSTTDDVYVIYVEGDAQTTTADLEGTGSNTEGNWVQGVDYPIIDDATIASAFQIAYYPTIYTICPNRVTIESGQATASAHYANVGNCMVANGTNNPALIGYTGETSSCSSIDVTVDLQNMGSGALTSATIDLMDGATLINSVNWSGNLSTYDIESVNVGSVTPTAPTTYTIVISSNDDNASDNTINQLLSPAPDAATNVVTVEIETDAYGAETTWEIRDGSNTVIDQGGPYNNLSAVGTTVQPPVDVTVPANDCINFIIMDSYGDGMDSGYGAGNYAVKDANGTTLVSGGAFGDEESGKFKSGVASLTELNIDAVNIYPNPATSVLNVAFDAANTDYTVAILDLSGRVLATNSATGANGAQTVSFPVNELAAGSYIVTISTGEGTHTENVVIK